MSGVVAHKLSGFSVPKEVLIETGRMATGDSEDEIRRSVWRVAAGAINARRSFTATALPLNEYHLLKFVNQPFDKLHREGVKKSV